MKLMQNKTTKEVVAAKWMPRLPGMGRTMKHLEREILHHKKLVHPNIIRFREVRILCVCGYTHM